LITNQSKKHLSLPVKNNGFDKIEIKQRIMEATSGLNNHYFTKIAKRMSVGNADLLARFIILNRKESIIAINTIKTYIDGVVYLENFHKHKDLSKMDRNDIVAFLDGYRKSDTVDPLHKWVATYNIRLMIISKFFRWMYSLNHDGLPKIATTEKIVPPIMGIKRFKRKEKSSYQAKDLWTQEDDTIFLKYCEDSRLRCYHMMARDTSGRPHELLKVRVGDIMWQRSGPAQYAEVTIGKSGKTVPRTVPLINSIPFVRDWIREHPTSTNRNAYVFISFEKRSMYRNLPLEPISLSNMYRDLKLEFFPRLLTNPDIPEEDKKKIRILLEKPWNPYIRRHSSLNEIWKLVKSEHALRLHAGWSKNSKMVEIYTHEFGNESSQLLLQAHGIIPTNAQEENILKPLQCRHCNEPNKPESRLCTKCGMVLTYDAYKETLEKEKQRELEVQNLREDIKSMHKQMNQIMVMVQRNPRLANIKPEILN
jgi:site-specific recombinase XerD